MAACLSCWQLAAVCASSVPAANRISTSLRAQSSCCKLRPMASACLSSSHVSYGWDYHCLPCKRQARLFRTCAASFPPLRRKGWLSCNCARTCARAARHAGLVWGTLDIYGNCVRACEQLHRAHCHVVCNASLAPALAKPPSRTTPSPVSPVSLSCVAPALRSVIFCGMFGDTSGLQQYQRVLDNT